MRIQDFKPEKQTARSWSTGWLPSVYKKSLSRTIGMLVVCLCLAGAAGCSSSTPLSNDNSQQTPSQSQSQDQQETASELEPVAGQVGERNVPQWEYELLQSMQRARISSLYYSQYGIDVAGQDDGWNLANEEGVSASDLLAQSVLEDLKKYEALRQMASELSVSVWQTQEELLQSQSQNQPVLGQDETLEYGAANMDLQSVYMSSMSRLEQDVFAAYSKKQSADEKQLKDLYASMDSSTLLAMGEYEGVVAVYGAKEGSDAQNVVSDLQTLQSRIESLQNGQTESLKSQDSIQAQNGLGLQAIAQAGLEKTIEQKEILELSWQSVSREDALASLIVSQANRTDAPSLFLLGEGASSVLVQVLSWKTQPATYEQLKSTLEQEMQSQNFQQELAKRIEEMPVSGFESAGQ